MKKKTIIYLLILQIFMISAISCTLPSSSLNQVPQWSTILTTSTIPNLSLSTRVTNVSNWPITTDGAISSTPTLVDIDNDGELEVVVGSIGGKIWALNGDGTNVTGWPVTTTGSIARSSPAVGDIDEDGELEVVVGTEDGKIWLLNDDGTNILYWPKTVGGSMSSPALGDIDEDGELEIIIGSTNQNIYAFNVDGTDVPGWPITTMDWVYSSPALGDIDGDGKLEIVVATMDGYMYALNGDGTSVPGWPVMLWDTVQNSPALGDIDGDGELEVVCGINLGEVYVLNGNGTDVPGWPQAVAGGLYSSPALGDIDGDGKLEIVVGTNSGTMDGWIYALNSEGTIVPGWPLNPGYAVLSSPALGDIDGDGKLEVVIGAEDNNTWALNGDGTNVTGWPINTGVKFGSPSLGDIDNDGLVEIVVGSEDNKIWAFNERGSYKRNLFPWPKFHHDEMNTGLYSDKFLTCNKPDDITTLKTGSEMIVWRLYDDFGGGKYRVWANDTNDNYYIWVDWVAWINNTPIYIPINRSATGIFNYTIEFTSNTGQITSDTIIVTIFSPSEFPTEILTYLMGKQGSLDTLDLLLSPLGLGIIITIAAAFLITIAVFIKKINKLNNQISVINKKIRKPSGKNSKDRKN